MTQLHRLRLTFLGLAILAILLISNTRPALAQKTFYWESFDVDIRLLENGDLDITEHQTLVFENGTFSFGFATINLNRLDNISNLTVREGDTVYTESFSNSPYTYELGRSSDAVRIDWYFPPTDGRHTYTFSYTVEGAVRVEDNGDQIFWMAIPEDVPGRIDSSTVSIHLPQGIAAGSNIAAVRGDESSNRVNVATSEDGRRTTFTTNGTLFSGDTLEVGVRFPTGQLDLATPEWQKAEQQNDIIGLAVAALSGLLLVTGPIGVAALWYTRGRDPQVGLVAEYLTEPPSDLPPAIAGSLIDETADMSDILSTLVDLARRGYLTIDESKKDHTFTRTDKSFDDLRSFERHLLNKFFDGRSRRNLSSLRYKFSQHLPQLRNMLYSELTSAQMFKRSPELVRTSYRVLGFGLMGLTAVTGFAAINVFTGVVTMFCLPIALVPTALGMTYMATHMPRKTLFGAEEAAKWTAFKTYLKEIEKYTNLDEATGIFEKYLPYAVAFGLERSWIRKFAQTAAPMPTWYGPYYPHMGRRGIGSRGGRAGRAKQAAPSAESMGQPSLDTMSEGLGGGLSNMSEGFSRMLTSSSTVLSSVKPQSSSGGGGFGGGFSGGSSGGGSRGFG